MNAPVRFVDRDSHELDMIEFTKTFPHAELVEVFSFPNPIIEELGFDTVQVPPSWRT